MRLIDLDPRWVTPDVFVFKNPTGGTRYLSCKRVLIPAGVQHAMFREYAPDLVIVSTNQDFAWAFEGSDFNTMTVTPSIDASPSGNWHGFITNGEIV